MKKIVLIAALAAALCSPVFAATPPLSVVPADVVATAPDAPVNADTAVVVQDGSTITIPYGNWIDQLAVIIRDIGVAGLPIILGFVLTALPAPIRMIAGPFLQKYAGGILDRAVDYGVNAAKGATKDGTLSIKVGNEVLAHAAQYFIDHAPAWLTSTLGGEDGVRQKIFARLNIPKEAGIEDFSQVSAAPVDPKKVAKASAVAKPRYPLAK